MKLKLLKLARFFHIINKQEYNEKRQIEIVRTSPLFDAKWYLEQNPDVREKGIDAAKHYVKFGWKEGRNPSPNFDGNEYLRQHPEAISEDINPIVYDKSYKELKQINIISKEKQDNNHKKICIKTNYNNKEITIDKNNQLITTPCEIITKS